MPIAIKINPKDNVVVALHPIAKGTAVPVDNTTVTAIEDIPQGHKMAIAPIKSGENVIKYGFPIGHATADAVPGTWMHTHNIHTNLSGEIEYSYHPNVHPLTPAAPDTFMGYRRKDGRAAIRNEIWIIPTVGCVNDCAKALVRDNQDLVTGSIDGLYTFTHPFGCSQTGHDHAQTRKLLASLVRHPNAGAVLVLSLGCENLTHEQFLAELGDYDHDRVKFLTCQDVEDELVAGREILKELAAYAAQFKREPIPASELVVGMKCGGSDGLSGITANPTIGRFSDMLCARGGSTVLTEVPEMFGAEGFLMDRCQNEQVFEKAVRMINGFKEYFISHNEVVYDNPSPGNKQGGITTLEDKSCGCVQKGGSAPIMDVIDYGEPVTTKGLNMLYGPGNDLVSATALTAAGAHMVLFSTGRGTPFGAPAPTLKIATNSQLAARKKTWIDFNILWHGSQQLLGEEIKVYMNDSTIDWAHIINQALAVEQKDSVHYNQVTGKEMKGFFVGGDMRQVDVNGNVLVVFYPIDDKDSTMIGLNYSEGSFLRMLLKERRMEQGAFIGKANGTLYPMDQIPADKYKLPSFVWFDYIRPRNKEDIFEWRGKRAGEQLQKSDRKPIVSPRNMNIKRNK